MTDRTVNFSKPDSPVSEPSDPQILRPLDGAAGPHDPGAFDLSSYGAALPRPEPLSAEQFLPVLTPGQFSELLDDLRGELQLVPDEAARSALTSE